MSLLKSLLTFLPILLLLHDYNTQAQTWLETQKAVASDRAADDGFGASVSISGNYAIVGAHSEDHDTIGGNTMTDAGSAYILERNGSGNWSQVQKIVASDRAADDRFGASVSISGNYAIVGAHSEDHDTMGGNTMTDAGSAYIFERDSTGKWNQLQKIVASDRAVVDNFGNSVSISDNYAIVGAYREDEDTAGGNTLGAAGSAYVFERDGSGNWNQVQKITATDRAVGDRFGISVSISGNYAIVGADGSTLGGAGSAYIFERDSSGNWNQVQKIVASDRSAYDDFGYSVSISDNYAIVGAFQDSEDAAGGNTIPNAGSTYIFEWDSSGNWNQVQKIVASDRAAYDLFGISVSISGKYIIVGAFFEEDGSPGSVVSGVGAAYIFERDSSGNWNQLQKIVASDRAVGDSFGWSVSISRNYAIVGAKFENEDAVGGNTLIGAGSAYFFKRVGDPNIIRGAIFSDQNADCVKDITEQGLYQFIVKAALLNSFGITDSQGNYAIRTDSGSYNVIQIIPSHLGPLVNQLCPASPDYYTVDFDTLGQDTTGFDFANDLIACPLLTIDISSNRRRRCFNNFSIVRYCNEGFADADSVQVHVQFPEYVHLVSADMLYTLDADSNYIFDIGTLIKGDCGTIHITDHVDCIPGITGLTQCTKAWITPANSCLHQLDTTIQDWDQSTINVKAQCEGDTVTFTINNHGADMQDSSVYRIYADGQLIETVVFILHAGQSLIIKILGNGQTIRIEVDQRPGHPGNSHPTATIEACGSSLAGTISTGFLIQLPSDDDDVAMEEHCLQIIDSYDPNDKLVQPGGITENHFVKHGVSLDYTIRFQNTGTDTAYNVILVDTLSDHLDIASIRFGVGSHVYSLDVTGKGSPVLAFTFSNINLPDSLTDEPNSHGFLKFKIAPYDSVQNGTIILNKADIYFDFNSAITTPDVWVTISDTVITGTLATSIREQDFADTVKIKIYPNPATNYITIKGLQQPTEFRLYDLLGREVLREVVTDERISIKHLDSGLYFYVIGQQTGKLVIE